MIANNTNLKKHEYILTNLKIDLNQLQRIKKVLNTDLNNYKKLCAIDKIINAYGVEYIEHETKSSNNFEYINTGDNYNLTFINYKNKIRIMTYSDIVEKWY